MEREHLENNRDIPEGNIENEDRISNDNPRNQDIALDLSINNALIRAPSQILSRQLHAPIAHSSRISESDNNHSETNDSAMRNEASAYISLKAALDFLPKYFDGSNIPVQKFIRDFTFAYKAVNPRDQSNLLWMIRSRLTGGAELALQDRDIKSLQDLINHIKLTCTEHRNLGQLNTMLATVAQEQTESVNDYGKRVGEILKNIVEYIEEKNLPEIAEGMIASSKETGKENFIMGLKRDLSLRVRLERPKTLQEAMNVARAAEWENNHEKGLNRMEGNKFTEGKFEAINENFKNRRDNLGHRVHRFAPYSRNALVHTMSGKKERFNVNYSRTQDENQMQGRVRDAVREGESVAARPNVSCFGCGGSGHLKRDCVRIAKSEIDTYCFNCEMRGHEPIDCTKPKYHKKTCYKCGKLGHISRFCTEKIANENKIICTYCKKPGHKYENCWSRDREIRNLKAKKEDNLNGK